MHHKNRGKNEQKVGLMTQKQNALYDEEHGVDKLEIPYSSDGFSEEEADYTRNRLSRDMYFSINDTSPYSISPLNEKDPYFIPGDDQDMKPVPEGVLKGLLNEEKIISQGIDNLLTIHSQLSMTGKSTFRLRKDLLQYLKSLGMLYQALAELYEKEVLRHTNILSTFLKWSQDKKHISNKIQEIKSEENMEGKKLKQLETEMDTLNEEIQGLENRLRQLKDKRKTLKLEIIQSQSVIESRSSTYIEELNDIESAERKKIQELAAEKSIYPNSNPTQNSNVSSLLNLFNSMSLSQINASHVDTIVETVARQVESFKDRTATYRSEELKLHETSLIWENTSELLDQLESDIQQVVTRSSQSPTQSTIIKTKIINLLNQAYESLSSLRDSLKIQNNSILEQLFTTEIDTISRSIHVLNPSFEMPKKSSQPSPTTQPIISKSSTPSIGQDHSINKNAISIPHTTAQRLDISIPRSSLPESQSTLIPSYGEMSQSPSNDGNVISSGILKDHLKGTWKSPTNSKTDKKND